MGSQKTRTTVLPVAYYGWSIGDLYRFPYSAPKLNKFGLQVSLKTALLCLKSSFDLIAPMLTGTRKRWFRKYVERSSLPNYLTGSPRAFCNGLISGARPVKFLYMMEYSIELPRDNTRSRKRCPLALVNPPCC